MLDFVDAFFRVPLSPDERQYFVIKYGDKFLRWNRIAQGSVNGPQLFGRLAALIGRLTQRTLDDSRSRLHIYLDDPIIAMRGSRKEVEIEVTLAVLMWRCMNVDLAFLKGQVGTAITWTGHDISINMQELSITSVM